MKTINYILCAMLALSAVSCKESPSPESDILGEGYIEYDDDTRYTVFHIPVTGNVDNHLPQNKVKIRLRPIEGTGGSIYDATLSAAANARSILCRMVLGSADIADGRYFVEIMGENLPLRPRFVIYFHQGVGTTLSMAEPTYDLKGSGTPTDPYIIGSQDDFSLFIYGLMEDDSHGYGLYFRQTDSFEAPRRSTIIDGRSWAPARFAGQYDGGGCELRNLAYIGAFDVSADKDAGLFSYLLDGAVVKNLSITNAIISNVADCSAILAGNTLGSVSISDVSVEGTVTAKGDGAAGLIGRGEGDLTISGVGLHNLVVSGEISAAGVVGEFQGKSLVIDNVSTPNNIFTITGTNEVGVIAGRVSASEKVAISSASVTHTVDNESSDTRVVYSSGDHAGVVAASISSPDISLHGITVKCPVSGETATGGLVGYMYCGGVAEINDILMASVVKGYGSVGGVVGLLRFADSNCSLTFGGNSNRIVIKQSAAAQIRGYESVGGLFGFVDGNNGKVGFKTPVEVAVNVTADTEYAGGAVGHLLRLREFDTAGLLFSSPTMRVTTGTRGAGGVVGFNEGGEIKGPHKFNLDQKMVSPSELTACFSGVVNAVTLAGGVVGMNTGSISGVACDASVTASGKYAAGIVAEMSAGSVTSAAFFGSVAEGGSEAVAGICARSYDGEITFSQCINFADISGNQLYQAGVVADADFYWKTLTIRYCVNKGNLSGGKNVGGVVARCHNKWENASHASINNCANYGDINAAGNSSSPVGGIAGNCDAWNLTISNCANHGDVSSSEVQYAIGGIVGHLGIDPPGINAGRGGVGVYESMNSGTITCAKSSTKLGGLVGYLDEGVAHSEEKGSRIANCYNIGDIPSDQKDDTGGILGCADDGNNIFKTFNRGKISHGNAIVGTHKGASLFDHSNNYYLEGTGKGWPSSTSIKASEIGNQDKYHNFDFNNVWRITDQGPVLRNCPFQ